jgi:hypothetical protein
MYDPHPPCQWCSAPLGYHDPQTGACPSTIRYRTHAALGLAAVIVLATGFVLLWHSGVIH